MNTKLKILNAGLKLWPYVTPSAIAREINMTHSAVLYHFPGCTLKTAVAKHAIEKDCKRVIVQLEAVRHPALRRVKRVK